MRSTTVIAPLASTKRIVQRANPFTGALKGTFIGAALLVFGLAYLVVSPIASCIRAFLSLFSKRG